jgi:hypothetical protein
MGGELRESRLFRTILNGGNADGNGNLDPLQHCSHACVQAGGGIPPNINYRARSAENVIELTTSYP